MVAQPVGFPGPSGPGLIEARYLASGGPWAASFPGPSGPGLIEAWGGGRDPEWIQQDFPGPSGPGLIEAANFRRSVAAALQAFPGPSGPGLIEAQVRCFLAVRNGPLSGAFRPRPH